MKRKLVFILALLVAFALAGCGGTSASVPSAASQASSQPSSVPPPSSAIPSTPQAEPEPDETYEVTVDKPAEGFDYAFTSVPPKGDAANPNIDGQLICDTPQDYKVVTLIRVGSIYGPKPSEENPYAYISENGNFSVQYKTAEDGNTDEAADRIYLYFVPREYEASFTYQTNSWIITSETIEALTQNSAYILTIIRP